MCVCVSHARGGLCAAGEVWRMDRSTRAFVTRGPAIFPPVGSRTLALRCVLCLSSQPVYWKGSRSICRRGICRRGAWAQFRAGFATRFGHQWRHFQQCCIGSSVAMVTGLCAFQLLFWHTIRKCGFHFWPLDFGKRIWGHSSHSMVHIFVVAQDGMCIIVATLFVQHVQQN